MPVLFHSGPFQLFKAIEEYPIFEFEVVIPRTMPIVTEDVKATFKIHKSGVVEVESPLGIGVGLVINRIHPLIEQARAEAKG